VRLILSGGGEHLLSRTLGWHASLFPTGRINMKKIAVGAWRETIAQHLCDLT